ncbi:hypothetical protein B0H15DRAFT_803431 [Mycena belliarum]|uniref:Uncharacterized protein n=1 Tax=Mycena belliarum TaxID=1033014 RepID=A0AAD6TWR4_9AGAR|nr:hypothetical protein B0H15DRAFT_803431 [Mycena belliae]
MRTSGPGHVAPLSSSHHAQFSCVAISTSLDDLPIGPWLRSSFAIDNNLMEMRAVEKTPSPAASPCQTSQDRFLSVLYIDLPCVDIRYNHHIPSAIQGSAQKCRGAGGFLVAVGLVHAFIGSTSAAACVLRASQRSRRYSSIHAIDVPARPIMPAHQHLVPSSPSGDLVLCAPTLEYNVFDTHGLKPSGAQSFLPTDATPYRADLERAPFYARACMAMIQRDERRAGSTCVPRPRAYSFRRLAAELAGSAKDSCWAPSLRSLAHADRIHGASRDRISIPKMRTLTVPALQESPAAKLSTR